MKKGAVEPWCPVDRWESPPRSDVKESEESEWFLWIARVVDRIEAEGRMKDFKSEGAKPNPSRDAILDQVCVEAFGSKYPTKEKRVLPTWVGRGPHVCERHSGTS